MLLYRSVQGDFRMLRNSCIAIDLMGTSCEYAKVSSYEEATSAIKTLWNAIALRRAALVLFNCYVDTLFVSIIPEHLKNHRIMPRFFYRWDGELSKVKELHIFQIGGLVSSAKKPSCPCEQGVANGNHFPEDNASGDD
jgi:hypothetical protein